MTSTTDPTTGVDHGRLPMWRICDLPEPLPPSLWNALKTIGPGAILLAGAIGGGEWIVGPLMVAKYGPTILWIATLGIFLQSLFNLEAIRYTLYTGEPILTGVMRLAPGPGVWGSAYILLGSAQLATPAIAAGCATVLFGAFAGRMPTATDQFNLSLIGTGVILVTTTLLLSGRSIERLLEKLSWAMIIMIFVFLIAVNVLCVPWTTWKVTTLGFVSVGPLPAEMSLLLLGLFAATAGSGGLGNLAVTNWFRDKGFGMGAYVGGISGALAHGHLELQSVGAICPVNEVNRQRWRRWWFYARLDQQLLWGCGCLLGMFLNVNLASAIIPSDAQLAGYEAGAFQAHYLAEQFGRWMWFLTLLNGFWILFSTHLGNTDCLVRTAADVLWASSPFWQKWPARKIYATLLLILTAWALVAIHLGNVMQLFQILGIMASPIMAIAAIQILRINTRFLPPEFRPPLWRKMALVGSVVVYGGISGAMLINLMKTIMPGA